MPHGSHKSQKNTSTICTSHLITASDPEQTRQNTYLSIRALPHDKDLSNPTLQVD